MTNSILAERGPEYVNFINNEFKNMPELIDLEVSRKNMLKKVKNRKVRSVKVDPPYVLRNSMSDKLEKSIVGYTLKGIKRKGKTLIFDFDESKVVIHLMLYGNFVWKKDLQNQKSIFEMCFDNDECINIIDRKKWTKIELKNQNDNISSKLLSTDFGIDPLSDEFNKFKLLEIIKAKSRSQIKSVLLNQSLISGIGNAYSDEILWDAKINPTSKCSKIMEENRVQVLFDSIKSVLNESLEEVEKLSLGESISEQSRGFMKVYRKEREPCPRCKTLINKITVCNRDTFVCANCQTLSN